MYRVNLLPPKLQREGIIDFRRLFVVSGVTLLAGVVLGGYGIFWISFLSLKNELAAARQQIASLRPVVQRVEGIKEERTKLEAVLKEYNDILKARRTWYDLFFGLGTITPVDLWLTGFELSYIPEKDEGSAAGSSQKDDATTRKDEKAESLPRPNTVTLKGLSRTLSSIGVFEQNLSHWGYFRRVELKKVSAADEGINFEITASLKEEE